MKTSKYRCVEKFMVRTEFNRDYIQIEEDTIWTAKGTPQLTDSTVTLIGEDGTEMVIRTIRFLRSFVPYK